MILKNVNQALSTKYDLIIFGSGPAGISLALEFQKTGKKILVVEAGGSKFSEISQDFYKSTIIGDEYGDTSVTRLRQIGGTSGLWAGVCRPLDKHDFANWPIDKKDLDKYLGQACKYLKIKNNFITEKFNNNFNIISYKKSDLMYADYLPQFENSSQLDFISNLALVDFELINDKVHKAILFSQSPKQKISLNSEIFVLAAGTIENNRIMLNLKKKYKNFFSDEMPLGKFYMDHPVSQIATAIVHNNSLYEYIRFDKFGNDIINDNFTVSIAPNYDFIKKNNILNTELMMQFDKYDKSPILNKNIDNLKNIAPNLYKKLKSNLNKEKYSSISFHCSPEQDQNIANRIELDNNYKDKLGVPRVKIYWKKSEIMRKTLRKCLENLGDFFLKIDTGRIGVYDFVYDKSSYSNEPGIHHLGGTRIGESEKDSVVDKNLKFHNLNNLYITGGSVFRTSGHANPTLSIVQISLRLSDYLKTRLI